MRFVSYNVLGGLLWALAVPLLGYLLGGLIPNLDRYILLVIGLVIVLSLIPVALELRRVRGLGEGMKLMLAGLMAAVLLMSSAGLSPHLYPSPTFS